ncbi:MAG TPA: hypothetical protein VGE02_04875 [Gemmatimonadales bacterium]
MSELQEKRRWPPERIARLALRAAIVLVILWLAGIAFLWVIWPR